MKAQPPPAAADPLACQVTGDPPAQSSHHDQQHHNGVDQKVVVIPLQAVGPESEAGVVVRRDAVEDRSPESLPTVGDIAEPEAVEHQGTHQDHQCRCEGDATECAAHAADPEFIQGLAPVEAAAQAGASHHKALEKGGDGHQSQTSRQDHQGQHQLSSGGEIGSHINDRETGHRDC